MYIAIFGRNKLVFQTKYYNVEEVMMNKNQQYHLEIGAPLKFKSVEISRRM